MRLGIPLSFLFAVGVLVVAACGSHESAVAPDTLVPVEEHKSVGNVGNAAGAREQPHRSVTAERPPNEVVALRTPVVVSDAAEKQVLYEDVVQEMFAEIVPLVLTVRGLPRVDIDPGFMDREEFVVYLSNVVAKDYDRTDIELDNIEWKLLGILAPGEDIVTLQLDLLGQDVLGFYDEDEKTMFVVTDDVLDTIKLRFVLAHEYVHALQDHFFSLGGLEEEVGTNNIDALNAFVALVEGDATVTGISAYYRSIALSELDDVGIEADGPTARHSSRAAGFLSELLKFSYEAGSAFVAQMVKVGGWERVNEVYSDLPQSTEQILYPDKYLDGELPRNLDFPDFSNTALPGWVETRRNVMGAFFLDLLFGGYTVGQFIDGWVGDEYAIYQHGMDNLMILKMQWEGPAGNNFWDNAKVFLQKDYLDMYTSEVAETRISSHLITWQKGSRFARLFRDGVSIYLVVGTDSNAVDRVWTELADSE